MGSVLKLPCVRFVKQVSNGVSLSKYGYVGMMERNAQAIQSAAWRKASCRIDDVALTVNKVTESDGVYDKETGRWNPPSTYTAWLQDRFDCFLQGGDGVMELGTMCGYAGMVAYRFALPTVRPGAIDDIKLLIQRDRYLRAGVRVAVEINNSDTPSNDWAVQRGENEGAIASPTSPSGGVVGVASWGFLHQYDIPHLMASRAWEGTLEFTREDFPKLNAAASAKYLWVYMSPEDFCSYWSMYNAKEQRYYTIEGSASLLSGCCTFAFATDAVAPGTAVEPVADVVWGRNVIGGNPIDISADMAASGINGDKMAIRAYGSLALCSGVSVVSFPSLPANLAGAVWNKISDGSSLLHGTFNREAASVACDMGKVESFIAPTEMNRLSGFPTLSVGGLFFLLRTYSPADDTEYFDAGFRTSRKTQMFLGATYFTPPTDKAEYSRFRILDGYLATKSGCEMSLNVWKSSSRTFFGGFPLAALQSLMCNSAMFTGNDKNITGSFSESLWPAVKDKGDGSFVCDGDPQQVSESVEAELIATVDVNTAYAEGNKMAIDVTGIKVSPGDVVILAPKVESVNIAEDGNAAYWGIPESFAQGRVDGLGMKPIVQFG